MNVFPNLKPPIGYRRTTCEICKKRTSLGIMCHIENRNWAQIHYEHFCKKTNKYEDIIKTISI